MATYGAGNWSKIKLGVPSRTDAQCRERYVSSRLHASHMLVRWVNVLDGKVKKGEWTREEDQKLLQLCQEYQDNGRCLYVMGTSTYPPLHICLCYICV